MPLRTRCLIALAFTLSAIGLTQPASASGYPMGGQGGQANASDGVHATLHTPDWYPALSGNFLYSWVMETGTWAPGCRYWVQVGWMASGGSVYAAEQAWVEPSCPGGWTTFHTYQSFPLGTDHRFEILNSGGNNWQVTVDNQIVDRVNLPSGPSAQAQVFVETDGVSAMPDITAHGIEAHSYGSWGGFNGGCWYGNDGGAFTFVAQNPCSYYVVRH